EVLDFSRLDARAIDVRSAVVRVGDVVEEARALVEPQAREAGISLVDSVSGRASGLALIGDEDGVRQILVNLLSNAVKFTPRRGRITLSAGTAARPPASVAVSAVEAEPWVYIRVEDTGPGISPERMSHVFEPFVQGDMALTREHGGTGLGLTISRRRARLMGGDISARSTVGMGSAFFLWLPGAAEESLRTGGLEGHGPGSPSPGFAVLRAAEASSPGVGTLRGIGDAVLAELERILQRYVTRLRSDPAMTGAHDLAEEMIEDHLATFIADVAAGLQMVDPAAGEATPAALDTTVIQRTLCERHGAQRARLGWAESEVRREFEILGEELVAGARRRAPHFVKGPTIEARVGEVESAIELLAQIVLMAQRISLASFRRAHEGAEPREER
ncbi:MAG TPA: ATP-binding protein, partial [Gemmatimonadaceae bacterium]|nr:ATP-binding protein [Gemmatimonadaceae bacterium]